ncbi:DMT family transporter [Thiospirochaeta perfilievii]|uniref:DMT family transporter n=1 Tax=Thiospirochaeta perfilievii TaxID=252967 RepID=A0A5C1Q7X4_9SPIO|nr:DMT family transporter [Thiospirochaeta perfilievii]QEN03497.1 DMT family transporter [Thiospirochaeta perfilievii]
MSKQKLAILLALLSTLLWSTVATSFKISLKQLNPENLVLYSTLISLFIFTIILVKNRRFNSIKNLGKKDILYSIISGFLNPFLYYLVLFKTYSLLPAQVAQPLNYTWPIILIIFSSIIFKEKLKRKDFLSFCLSLVGISLVSSNSFSNIDINGLGVILGVLSAVIWALYWVINRVDSRENDIKLFLNFLFGSIFILIYNFLFVPIQIPNMVGILSTIYVGLFEMGITFYLWANALKYANKAATISLIVYLSPFLSLIFISIFLKETITITTIIGLILIVSSILYNKLAGK